MRSPNLRRTRTRAQRRDRARREGDADPILGWAASLEHRAKLRTLIAKHGGRCALCGDPVELVEGPDEATIDHVVPVSKGGVDLLSNLQLAHRKCNQAKGNQ